MKRKQWIACLMALVLMLTMALPAQAADASEEVTATEQNTPVSLETVAQTACTSAVAYSAANSIAWAVWEAGEITASGELLGQQNAGQEPIGELYGIGSVSKMFTTVAVMQLVEQHRISLDAPVTQYLPDFRMADPRYREITVRMLLNHSSGLMGSSIENALLFDDADSSATDELLERLSTQMLKADPGAYSVYCNDGFTLAELIVEAVSGQDFMDYVRAHILAPAGIQEVYAPENVPDADLAPIYASADTRPLPADYLNIVGAGGMFATAADLAAFGGALTGTALLRQSSLEAMAAPEYARGIWPEDTLDALAFGLGWDNVEWYPFEQSGITALVKGGDTLYYHAALVVIPEYQMAAAVLSSAGSSLYNELAATQMLIAALAEQGVNVDQTVPSLESAQPAAMPADVAKNAGYYGATAAQYQVSISDSGTLTLHYLNYPTIPDQAFTYYSDGSFRDSTGTIELRLVEEKNGKVYLYQKAVTPIPGLGALPTSNYGAVKLEDSDISDAVQAVWDDLNVQGALVVSEKYTSQVYANMTNDEVIQVIGDAQMERVPGYIAGIRIVDETTACYDLQIPGNAGRDGQMVTLEEENGRTLLRVNAATYVLSEQVPEIYTGGGWSYTTVGQDGYARWYHVGDAAGTTMTVQLPEEASFWVYDASGTVTAASYLWDDSSAVLPEDGMVVFVGEPGARFHLQFT